MFPDSIQLVIVTPTRQLLRETVVDVQLPGADGYLGVLPGHAPLMTELGIGELNFKTSAGTQATPIAIMRGFAEVLPDRVTMLAETAEMAAEIDLARAQEALRRAQERLAKPTQDMDWDRATAALARAFLRVQIVQKHQGVSVVSAR